MPIARSAGEKREEKLSYGSVGDMAGNLKNMMQDQWA
jgi:hypothetical protein